MTLAAANNAIGAQMRYITACQTNQSSDNTEIRSLSQLNSTYKSEINNFVDSITVQKNDLIRQKNSLKRGDYEDEDKYNEAVDEIQEKIDKIDESITLKNRELENENRRVTQKEDYLQVDINDLNSKISLAQSNIDALKQVLEQAVKNSTPGYNGKSA